MSAHTPGPWRVGKPTGYVNQLGIEPAIGCAYGAGDEVKANAQLMASAPFMLDALREALEFAEGQEDVVDGPDGVPSANAAMQLAQSLREAIFAATGAAP